MSMSTSRRRISLFGRSPSATKLAGGSLPAGWSKLDTPTIGRGTGHVLVGPGGVYFVTATRRSGAFRVSASSGANDPVVEQCRRDASLVGRHLTLALGSPTVVHPVVVVEGADVQVLEQPMGVTIVASALLRNYLESQPDLMREAGLQRVRSALAVA
jgi:hypothetical protein